MKSKKKQYTIIALLVLILITVVVFTNKNSNSETTDEYNENSEAMARYNELSELNTPESQESAYKYSTYFIPEVDDFAQPYVGDPMPYYEDGVYYIYYLKDGGDSYNHSIYLATTTDFVTYDEQETPVLESSALDGQDNWIGTGSVVKIKDTYYLFYTGHNSSAAFEYKEKIMLAKSDNLNSFEKVSGWEIVPPSEIGQKNDFRDPQVYYDAETGNITMTITASQDGTARILKYTISEDLTSNTYDGIIYTNQEGDFWNLECSDTFKIGDKWYLTYSAQDDTLWYAMSDNRYGPYTPAKRMDGKLFYASKHVENENDSYMVGWARRADPMSSNTLQAWAGNLVVQKLVQKSNGDLTLVPVDAVSEQFKNKSSLLIKKPELTISAKETVSYKDVFRCYESFMIKGDFNFSDNGSFGLYFDYNGEPDNYKTIEITPNAIQLYYNDGKYLIAEQEVSLQPNKDYSFTYIQEGSVGVFYIDNEAVLTVRVYGVSGKPIGVFTKDNKVKFSNLSQLTK